MGLFSRSNPADDDNDFDQTALPSSNDLKANPFTEQPPAMDFSAPLAPRTKLTKTGYGIEDAIKLMKALPRDNNEVVVTVVKKTLESTDIHIENIIDDANSKEERIRANHKTLEDEIKQLQDQIAQRNQRISELLQDLKETTDVRQRLQLALSIDKGKTKAEAPAPAARAPEAAGQAEGQRPAATAPQTAQTAAGAPQPARRPAVNQPPMPNNPRQG